MKIISKNTSPKKPTLFGLMLFSLLFFLSTPKVNAWDSMAAAIAKQIMEETYDTIKGITLASLKQAAIQMILEETAAFLNDVDHMGTAIITDWKDYLYDLPERESTKFMNDYLSGITKGRSSSRYRKASVSKTLLSYEGFGGKDQYQFALIKNAQADSTDTSYYQYQYSGNSYDDTLGLMVEDITNTETPVPTCTDADRANMFANGNLDNFWKCTEGINYAPLAYAHLKSVYEEKKEEKKEIQKNQQSGGIRSTVDENGNVITPSSITQYIASKAEGLYMDATATAEKIPEIVASVVTQAIKRSIQQGVGAIKNRLQREVSNVRRSVTKQISNEVREYGPGAVFNDR